MGTGIVLRRLIRKLFDHVNNLQPSEMDEEFIYESAISYQDYSTISTFLDNNKFDCASLRKLDTILSNFMTMAEVKRPTQNNLFTLLSRGLFSPAIVGFSGKSNHLYLEHWPGLYMLIVLLLVCLLIWFLRSVAKYSEGKSVCFALFTVGFVQYIMHQNVLSQDDHQLKLDRCTNPSYISQFLSRFNYDRDNCKSILGKSSLHSLESNVAMNVVQFLSELILRPLMSIATKVGLASQSFLNSFSSWHYYTLGPIYLAFIYICITFTIIFTLKYIIKSAQSHVSIRNQRPSYQRAGPSMSLLSPTKRKAIKHSSANGGSHKKNKGR